MLQCLSDKGSARKLEPEECTFSWEDNHLVLRSNNCQRQCPGKDWLCVRCSKLANNKDIVHRVAGWALKLELARYAHCLAYKVESDRRAQATKLREGEWMKVKSLKNTVQGLQSEASDLARLISIKKKLDSIQIHTRTDRLQAWLTATLGNLHISPGNETER